MFSFFWTLRFRLIILILLAIVPALGFMVYTAAEQRRQALSIIREDTQRLARLAAANQDHFIEGARQLLVAIGHMPAVLDGDISSCNTFFAELLPHYPQYANFFAARPNGELFCSATPIPGPINSPDLQWFQEAIRTRDFSLGNYRVGRITNKPGLVLAHPIFQADRIQTVVCASLDIAWLNRIVTKTQIPVDGEYILVDRGGTVLAHNPHHQKWVGQNLAQTKLVNTTIDQQDGIIEAPGLDGLNRIYAYAAVRETVKGKAIGLYVIIGTPKAAATDAIDRILAYNLIGLGLVTLLASLVAWSGSNIFVLRRVRSLVAATKRLASGDLSARTNLPHGQGEIGELARSFDEMADTMERQNNKRMEAEEALKKERDNARNYLEIAEHERKRLKNILDTIEDGVCIINQNYEIEYLNPAGVREFGSIEGRKCFSYFYQRGEICPQCRQQFTLEGEPARWEWNSPTNRKTYEFISVPLEDPEGGLYRLSLFRDMTDWKRSEAEIKLNESRLQSLLSLSQHQASSIHDLLDSVLDEAIVLTGSKVGYIFHYDEEKRQFTLHNWSKEAIKECYLANPQTIYELDETGMWGEAVRQRKLIVVNDFQAPNPLKKGYPEGHVHLHKFLTIPLFSDGKIVAVVGVGNKDMDYNDGDVRQLTLLMDAVWKIAEAKKSEQERKKLESQLYHTQKMEAIGMLAGGIAHDFNNILASIFGYAELAIEDAQARSEGTEFLQEILKAAKRAKELVKQILVLSRQEEQVKQPVEVSLIVKETMKLLRASLPTSIQIKQEISAQENIILGDPTQIHQVLMNLCTNAAHAMEGDIGTLRVELSDFYLDPGSASKYIDLKPGPYLKLVVSDTGHGIGINILDRIFDPFFTTKPKGKGTGMGLAIVHGIIKNHDGTIRVYSELGRGTTFTILLPAIKGLATSTDDGIEEVPGGSETILFVDDEPEVAGVGKWILERLGYKVTMKTSSIETLDEFIQAPNLYDLVITDMAMPDLTGDKLAKEILTIRPNIPIIICTGFSQTISEEKAKEMGIKEFVFKPIDRTHFAKVVRKVLDQR
ncbi:MAG: GAF domain-containing protein [Deltaproteobacteria bacterium]|nr:GAF domain-containing protein [Deltaproteobacteria bacterium]